MANQSGWSNLRWPVKAIIIALPIIGAVWAAKHFNLLPGSDNTTTVQTDSLGNKTTTTNNGNSTEPKEKKGEPKQAGGEHRSFAYQPEKPVDGIMKGVVEVGASGFNSFVIKMDKEKRWEIISKDFGQSFAYEGLATTEDIRFGLKKYIGTMFDRGVASKNIHFVVSSGAQKEPKTLPVISELKKMGYVVNLVTPDQEGKLALKSVQPPSYHDNSFVTDMGSGNTKISWYDGDNLKALEGPGAKYYEKNTADDVVYNDIKTKASAVPKDHRDVCFIIGGVPFELASKTRDGEERYTVLNDPSTYKSDKQKVTSGVNIYKALVDATGCDTFVFDWDANFTIGYLLSLPY